MTIGIGGSTPEQELSRLTNMTADVRPIAESEYHARIQKAQKLMQEKGISALYLHAKTNLYYFTGTPWYPSERMVGAIIPAEGPLAFISPKFEIDTLKEYMVVKGPVLTWEEHESPYQLFERTLNEMGVQGGVIAIDESTPFFVSDGIRAACPGRTLVSGTPVTAGCRMQKSSAELVLLQRAKNMTLEVHKAAARILRPGISTLEVEAFISQAHQMVGAPGSSFCIVLFGEATAYPHGVKDPQVLQNGDTVLIDTGCLVQGYNSDITRTYVFGQPTERQREVWNLEKAAQAAAFSAAKLGVRCGDVDLAARKVIQEGGFGPDYALPGLPHRTGHGIGLDIHEWPYLVMSDDTPLAPGMCFSNEPMICIPGEFGIRHEDHFYMTDTGPRWFTTPAHSIDDPFGLDQ